MEDYARPHLVIMVDRIHSVLFPLFSPIFYLAAISQVLMAFAIRSTLLCVTYGHAARRTDILRIQTYK